MGLMGDMVEKWMTDNAACLHGESMTGPFLGSLVLTLLIALLLHKFGVSTFKGGAIAAGWVMLLMMLWYSIWNASTFKAYGWDWLPYDVIGNTITAAIAGGVIGWIYGKVK